VPLVVGLRHREPVQASPAGDRRGAVEHQPGLLEDFPRAAHARAKAALLRDRRHYRMLDLRDVQCRQGLCAVVAHMTVPVRLGHRHRVASDAQLGRACEGVRSLLRNVAGTRHRRVHAVLCERRGRDRALDSSDAQGALAHPARHARSTGGQARRREHRERRAGAATSRPHRQPGRHCR